MTKRKIKKDELHPSTLPTVTAAAPAAALAIVAMRIYWQGIEPHEDAVFSFIYIVPADFILMSILFIILALTIFNRKKLPKTQVKVRIISCLIGISASLSFYFLISENLFG